MDDDFYQPGIGRFLWEVQHLLHAATNCKTRLRAVTKKTIGEGGVNIHIFMSKQSISKEIRRAEHDYMNIHPPSNITLVIFLQL